MLLPLVVAAKDNLGPFLFLIGVRVVAHVVLMGSGGFVHVAAAKGACFVDLVAAKDLVTTGNNPLVDLITGAGCLS